MRIGDNGGVRFLLGAPGGFFRPDDYFRERLIPFAFARFFISDANEAMRKINGTFLDTCVYPKADE